uniref:exopolysaccharide biosynthesis protein n=1 Tax=Roseivirga sp. TaxID=1964215 RepID=UPI0040486383
MDERTQIQEEKISLAGLIRNVQDWLFAMLGSWKKIILGAFVIGGLFFAYQQLRKINYTAETTFVLESETGGGIGQLGSLASLAGVNLGSLSEGSVLFQIDNIIELYQSYTIIKETLLTEVGNGDDKERLITKYGQERKLDKKWLAKGIDFEIPLSQMIVRHDSVLKKVVKDIRERNLAVAKPSRKLSILSVAYTSTDEEFAKDFNEVLVGNVNDFYLKSKTKKSGENLRVLAFQADSVKKVLDQVILDLAQFDDRNPNLNPLRSENQVPRQKIMIDLQASSAVYQEIVKNLEIAKLAHRNNTPLIQTIDKPTFPLKDDRMKWYKAAVVGVFLGGILMVTFLSLTRIYYSVMEDEKASK